MLDVLTTYLPLFALTIAVECALLLPFLRWSAHGQARTLLGYVALVNLITHPLATFAVVDLGAPWLAVEATVIAVEVAAYLLLRTWPPRWAVALAIFANIVTAAIGLALAGS